MIATLLANSYLHRIDPIIFPIVGDLAVRWYGTAYIIGFIIAWLLIRWMARSRRSAIPVERVSDFMFAVVIGVLLGGRLGYVFFYDQSLLVDFSSNFPYWGVLAINKGGMASHGGMIGVVLACAWFGWRCRVSPWHIMDVGAIVATPGLFLGRIANFINAELWGRKLPEAMQQSPPWWSVKYPQEMQQWSVQELAALREVMPEVDISRSEWNSALQSIVAQPDDPPRESLQLILRGVERLIDAAREGNELVIETIQPLLTAHYPSQLLQALTDGPALAAVVAIVWLRPRKPGVPAGAFLIAYGVMRILSEMVREPDAGVAMMLGLSRGQVLSVLVVLIGAALVWWCAKREAPSMGGLLRRAHT